MLQLSSSLAHTIGPDPSHPATHGWTGPISNSVTYSTVLHSWQVSQTYTYLFRRYEFLTQFIITPNAEACLLMLQLQASKASSLTLTERNSYEDYRQNELQQRCSKYEQYAEQYRAQRVSLPLAHSIVVYFTVL